MPHLQVPLASRITVKAHKWAFAIIHKEYPYSPWKISLIKNGFDI